MAENDKLTAYKSGDTTSESPIDLLSQHDTGEHKYQERLGELDSQFQDDSTEAQRRELNKARDTVNVTWLYGAWEVQRLVEDKYEKGGNCGTPLGLYKPQQLQQRDYMTGIKHLYQDKGSCSPHMHYIKHTSTH